LASSAAIITKPTFTLADRLRIQQECANSRDFIVAGKLTTVVLERQMSTAGMSQSRPRWGNKSAASMNVHESMHPFSEWQTKAWASLTLDWLHHKNAPTLAISRDRKDMLLPFGITPLPDIPDPAWTPKRANDPVPRIPQLMEDRAYGQLKSRDGVRYLVFQPVVELCLMLHSVSGGFGRIRGMTDPADGTHLALLIQPDTMQAYFVGGRFQMGM
jgi:hypothetical protein